MVFSASNATACKIENFYGNEWVVEIWVIEVENRDVCRRNDDSCKQQPNLAPIQSEHERVSFKMEI